MFSIHTSNQVGETPTTFHETTSRPELPLSLLKEINWDGERLAVVDGEWQIISGEATSSLEIEEIAHAKFSSFLSINDKVELFQSISALFEKRGDSWQQVPTLPCSVSDAHATQNIEVPLSAISSWHYFQQLYSGGYAEEQRDHLSVELPPGYTIPAFEVLLSSIDVRAEGLSFKDFLDLCSLGSFFGARTSFTNLDTFEPSLENVALLVKCDALPTFAPYKEAVSSMISRYLCDSSEVMTDGHRLTTADILEYLTEVEGFREWAETFPIDLNLKGYHGLIESSLDYIAGVFRNIDHLGVAHRYIERIPESCSNVRSFFAQGTTSLNDISVFNNSKRLISLKLYYGNVSSLPLNCPHLAEVDLRKCRSITSLEPLNGSLSLKKLSLYFTPFGTLPSGCRSLESVEIHEMFSDRFDMANLDDSLTLKHLSVSSCLNKVYLPTGCKNLSTLNINFTNIQNFEALHSFPQIRTLILRALPDLQEIPKSYQLLEELHLQDCSKVQDLSFLDGSTTIRRLLFLDKIPDIRLPQGCPNLKIEVEISSYR